METRDHIPTATLDFLAVMFRRRIIHDQSNTGETIKEMPVGVEQFA
ncbi:MAG: hypothetical protein LBE12_05745 [Planctomycetaceae bacterium]|jgi:hypothetical protein|nr:hypothetical protein [Planctomycetaceae bacterium]